MIFCNIMRLLSFCRKIKYLFCKKWHIVRKIHIFLPKISEHTICMLFLTFHPIFPADRLNKYTQVSDLDLGRFGIGFQSGKFFVVINNLYHQSVLVSAG